MATAHPEIVVGGALAAWSPTTIDFAGPMRTENPETFRDFRLDVTFDHLGSGQRLICPGFFAADGSAAQSGARAGRTWRVVFTPPTAGAWRYRASFRTGADIAVRLERDAGRAHEAIDGAAGQLTVAAPIARAPSLRACGPATLDGADLVFPRSGRRHPRRFAPSSHALAASTAASGASAVNAAGSASVRPRPDLWRAEDPVWAPDAAGDDGKGVLGACRAIAATGATAVWIAPIAARGGSLLTSPWARPPGAETDAAAALESGALGRTFDVARLDRWSIVFERLEALGISVHLALRPQGASPALLSVYDRRELDLTRRLLVRELAARFGHLNGLVWGVDPSVERSLDALDAYGRPRAASYDTSAAPSGPAVLDDAQGTVPATTREVDRATDMDPAPARDERLETRAPQEIAPEPENAATDETDEPVATPPQGAIDADQTDRRARDPGSAAAASANGSDPTLDEAPEADTDPETKPEPEPEPDQKLAPQPVLDEKFPTDIQTAVARAAEALDAGRDAVDPEPRRAADPKDRVRAARAFRRKIAEAQARQERDPRDPQPPEPEPSPPPTAATGDADAAQFDAGAHLVPSEKAWLFGDAEPKALRDTGAGVLELSVHLVDPDAPDRAEPLDRALGATRSELSDRAIVARIGGADAPEVETLRLVLGGSSAAAASPAHPFALFEPLGPAAPVDGAGFEIVAEAGDGSVLKRFEMRVASVRPAAAAETNAAARPDLAALATPDGPKLLRAQLIDPETDRPLAMLSGEDQHVSEKVGRRPVTVQATFAGVASDDAASIELVVDGPSARTRFIDAPSAAGGVALCHFYDVALAPGRSRLAFATLGDAPIELATLTVDLG